MTRQRAAIYEELQSLKTHPTADELYHIVRRKLPQISLGTVYRNLDRLVETGQVRKLDGGGQGRFDADLSEHYHIRCLRCNRIDDIHEPVSVRIQGGPGDNSDFEVFGYNLEFSGICRECRGKNKAGLNSRQKNIE